MVEIHKSLSWGIKTENLIESMCSYLKISQAEAFIFKIVKSTCFVRILVESTCFAVTIA